ncbi:MAG: hypothetical protein LAN36_13295 [Acidobacteriia bacterium]|nr:hypothetical protein [Terriglobia bacterium]
MSSAARDPGMDKRRSSRVVQALPIKVQGVDALHEPFTELTSTVMVSCHGCKYQSKHYVPKGSTVTLQIPRANPAYGPRTINGNVIWVQRPRHAHELLHIGLEFETAGNVWDIPAAPEDWFPVPGEPEPVIEVAVPEEATPMDAAPNRVKVVSWDLSEVRTIDEIVDEQPAPMPVAHHAAHHAPTTHSQSPVTAEAMDALRHKLDGQIHDAIEQALHASIERLSDSAVQKIVEQAAARAAEIVEAACEAATDQLDARIEQAVENAVNNLSGRRRHRLKQKN